MEITVHKVAEITNAPKEIINHIKEKLTIHNPMFNRKMEMGLSVWGIMPMLKYYSYNPKTNTISIPIGAINEVLPFSLRILGQNNIKIIDKRVTTADKDFWKNYYFKGKLRDYQEAMLKALEGKTVGIIEATTGSGKTVTFIKKIFDIKLNTLIIVNTVELLNQTIEALLEFSNLKKDDIGIIGNKKYIIKPISIALHQTLMKLPEEKKEYLSNYFGTIIADEVHICAADQYYTNLTSLAAKYKFGFSATPKDRADGLSKVVFWSTGPLIYSVPPEATRKSLIKPKYIQVHTNYDFPLFDSSDYTYMMTDMAINTERNKFIADYILKNFNKDGYYVVILCNYLSQIEELHKLLGDKSAYLTSKMKKKDRAAIMESLNKKEIKYIISTYGLFSTGINVPHLNVLVLAAPKKSTIQIKQARGRIMRKAPGKTSALVVDFVDYKIGMLRNQAKLRKALIIED